VILFRVRWVRCEKRLTLVDLTLLQLWTEGKAGGRRARSSLRTHTLPRRAPLGVQRFSAVRLLCRRLEGMQMLA
jgi:hypothetical protein